MQGELSAIGDVMTGTLGARALEPKAGEGDHGHGDGLCLNCGTQLTGAYCHACGQSAEVHRSVGAIGHEIAHGVFHFEGKVWRTLPLLALHPGTLTRRYIAGERARFVSPLALFLFTVFLMFALYSWIGPSDIAGSVVRSVEGTQAGLSLGRGQIGTTLGALEHRRADEAAAGHDTKAIDAQIVEVRADLVALARVQARVVETGDQGGVKTGWPWLDHGVARVRANPSLAAYKAQSSAYKYSWVLIPLSTPFVALLFLWRRGYGLYDHAIFVTYSISFMSLLVILLELATTAGIATGFFWTTAWIVPPVHMFAQLRGAYRLSIFSALWRTAFLLLFASIALLMFLIGLVAMGLSH